MSEGQGHVEVMLCTRGAREWLSPSSQLFIHLISLKGKGWPCLKLLLTHSSVATRKLVSAESQVEPGQQRPRLISSITNTSINETDSKMEHQW